MTDITYGTATPAAASAAGGKRRSLIARIIDALYEARMRQAQREISRYLHLVPKDILEGSEFGASLKDADKRPFVR
jgi:hypothetical protein